jgi:hypothetical protein
MPLASGEDILKKLHVPHQSIVRKKRRLPKPAFFFQDIWVNLFQHESLHVLVYTGRLLELPVVHQWWRDTTER